MTAALEAAQIVEHLKMLKINDSGFLGELGWQAAKEIERLLSTAKGADRMRSALEDARLQIEYLHEKFQETGSGSAVLARIDAALLPSEGTKG